jgi:hypothetical protein
VAAATGAQSPLLFQADLHGFLRDADHALGASVVAIDPSFSGSSDCANQRFASSTLSACACSSGSFARYGSIDASSSNRRLRCSLLRGGSRRLDPEQEAKCRYSQSQAAYSLLHGLTPSFFSPLARSTARSIKGAEPNHLGNSRGKSCDPRALNEKPPRRCSLAKGAFDSLMGGPPGLSALRHPSCGRGPQDRSDLRREGAWSRAREPLTAPRSSRSRYSQGYRWS